MVNPARITIPWPPSANHYKGTQVILPSVAECAAMFAKRSAKDAWLWLRGNVRASWFVKREGQRYYDAVRIICGVRDPMEGPLAIDIALYPPDRRARDADNTLKCILDSLQKAGVVKNDSQFVDLRVRKHEPVSGGKVVVEISAVGQLEL